jgi:FtsP/CotA-like multicopper oxidase with cupredoxin domain
MNATSEHRPGSRLAATRICGPPRTPRRPGPVNETGQDHPFHLHGFFFQVVLENGEPPPVLAWKDTVNVPRKSRARIAWLPDDRPGQWMHQCHILERHAMGMMAHFELMP